MRLRKLGINGIPKKDQLAQIKKINIWKWLFLGLVSLLVALGLVVQSRLATPREDVRQLQRTAKTSDVQVGTMTTTRDQFNDTIKHLLKKYHLSDYKVYADNQQILLEGQLSLLGNPTPCTFTSNHPNWKTEIFF